MRIGIIGSGNIGGTLTERFRALKHDVTVANARGPASLAPLAERTGARAGSVEEAARSADLVVLAVPMLAVPELPGSIFDGRVLVDAANFYPAWDGHIAELEAPHAASSLWVARHFPDATVVKTFNTIYFAHLDEHPLPPGAGRRALPVAADDATAKEQVMGLVDELGFDPVDAGSLAESWRQQPGTAVYNTRLDADGVRRALAAAE